MQNEIDIIRDISEKFSRAGIQFMLTGSVAMNYYAQPRMTRDIDVVIDLDSQQADAIMAIFGADYYVDDEAVRMAVAQESLFNLIHHESVIKVDCIVRKASEYRRLEFDRRSKVALKDFTTWIVSKEDLRSEFQLRGRASMKDTPPEIEARVRKMIMARSNEERFVMGALMFDAARDLVLASLPMDLPEAELRSRLFERFYGAPLSEFTKPRPVVAEARP